MGGYVIKPKYSFSETTKKPLTIGVMIFAAFISVIFMTYMAFGASGERQDPTCGVLDWNAKCQLSPTGHMLFGDVITGGSIALFLSWFFHRLSSKNTLKIEQLMDTE